MEGRYCCPVEMQTIVLYVDLYKKALISFHLAIGHLIFAKFNSQNYSRFQVTFQSAVAKFVLNIPNYITKFGILRGNLLSKICKLLN